MKTIVTGVLLAGFALAVPATAAPGQCSITGFDTFECDVVMDGGGLTFGLPDGEIFAFALVAENRGQGYRIPAGSRPGQRPVELGVFRPVEGEPGCWLGDRDEIRFCASIAQ